MKNLKEYILERESAPKAESSDNVWIVKDKDLDGAIFDVCPTEEDAKKAYDKHMEENEYNHLEIEKCKKEEVEKA